MLLLGNLMWVPAVVLVGVFVPLLYPTGHLPSPRGRAIVIVVSVAMSLAMINTALSPFSAGSVPVGMINPLAVGGTFEGVLSVIGVGSTLAAVVCFPLAAASLIIRYRRASGVERAQLKWFAAVAAIVGVSFAVAMVTSGASSGPLAVVSNGAWLLLFAGLALLPVAIGIAILRYRLYEIDRLVSRTIAYGVLTLVLGLLFVGVVLGLQALLAPFTGGNTLAVAGSTLLVAALFQPFRERIRRLVDQRFNRSRYDAERAVATLAGRLHDQVDLAELRTEIAGAVARTGEPASVSLWLRE